jgi:subtilisin family serine protease
VFSTSWNYTKDQPSYEGMSGTSQASPQVAALAALLLSKGVTTNATDTLERLIATSRDLGPAGRDESYGFGVINAAAALNAPAVTGLRVVDDAARNLLPRVQGTGEFRAWLGDGTYRVIAGTDVDANGVFGEVGEPRAETAVTLGASQPSVRLPDLVVR